MCCDFAVEFLVGESNRGPFWRELGWYVYFQLTIVLKNKYLIYVSLTILL